MNSYPARRRGGRLRNAFLLLHIAQAFDFSSFGKKPAPKKKTFQESFETYKNKINLPEDAGAFAHYESVSPGVERSRDPGGREGCHVGKSGHGGIYERCLTAPG